MAPIGIDSTAEARDIEAMGRTLWPCHARPGPAVLGPVNRFRLSHKKSEDAAELSLPFSRVFRTNLLPAASGPIGCRVDRLGARWFLARGESHVVRMLAGRKPRRSPQC